jgi:hypothetical protein
MASNCYKKKKKIVSSAGKNPENLQILKLQYLDFQDSVSDDFFFEIGFFSERNSDIQPVSTNSAQKYTENFKNVTAVFFFFFEKQICKNKKYLSTMSAQGKCFDTTC